mgnify:CR=1 FL=1
MLARLLLVSMVFSLTSTGIVVNAEPFSMNDASSIESTEMPSEEEPSEKVPVEDYANKLASMNDGSFIECTEMPSEEVPVEEVEEVEEITANKLDRTYTGKYYVLQERAGASAIDINAVDNTDPNYAYLVTNDTTMQGTIGAVNEMR